MFWFKSTAQVDKERREAETSREKLWRELQDKADAHASELKRSDLAGHYWDVLRLVDEASKRVVNKLVATDKKWGPSMYGDYACADAEWRTSDGVLFAELSAAKRHQETLT